MSDNSGEKDFLLLLILSLLVHVTVGILVLNLPDEKKAAMSEPFMVDLEEIPTPQPPEKVSPSVSRQAEVKQRVQQEIAPKGDAVKEKITPLPELQRTRPSATEPLSASRAQPGPAQSLREISPRDELFKKKGGAQSPDVAALNMGAVKMARLEESYRKKYGPEVADGDTRFLNTDDIQFGSFLRRFETAVYGVWKYPVEAAKMGLEGITPVKITFNRRGEIVDTEILQSSGSRILDNEVLRTLKEIGPVGSFPKRYEKETFNVIAFFHYGITQGAMRSLR